MGGHIQGSSKKDYIICCNLLAKSCGKAAWGIKISPGVGVYMIDEYKILVCEHFSEFAEIS